MDADVIVAGRDPVGLVAAHELTSWQGVVALVDQENAANPRRTGLLVLLRWPLPRRLLEQLRLMPDASTWPGATGRAARFDDRGRGPWAVRWARAVVEWVAGEKWS